MIIQLTVVNSIQTLFYGHCWYMQVSLC